jgi:hypothetical protein
MLFGANREPEDFQITDDQSFTFRKDLSNLILMRSYSRMISARIENV